MNLVPATDPVLWTPAAEVTDPPAQVFPHLVAMARLMREHRGIGLAAPQVGVPFSFFVTALPDCPLVINPTILCRVGLADEEEGCLTFPGQHRVVQRAIRIWAEWTDEDGDRVDMVLRGLAARVFQHEAEHLLGQCIFARPSIAS